MRPLKPIPIRCKLKEYKFAEIITILFSGYALFHGHKTQDARRKPLVCRP